MDRPSEGRDRERQVQGRRRPKLAIVPESGHVSAQPDAQPGGVRSIDNRTAIAPRGVMIAAGFGIGWTVWGASGLTGTPATVVSVLGIVAGVVILARANRLRCSTHVAAQPSWFRSRGYWIVVALELAAVIIGAMILGAASEQRYIAPWVAAVVGVHFLAFGRLFAWLWYLLGALLIAGAIAALIVGMGGGSAGAIRATAGLSAAATLLIASAWSLARHHRLTGRAPSSGRGQ